MTGPQAAELFYDRDRFARRGAMPGRIQRTLLGRGGVQGLDDEAHRSRKRMLMSLMTPERIGRLSEITAGLWHTYARKWESVDEVVLYDEARELLTRAVCAWAGVPLAESEVRRRTGELSALFCSTTPVRSGRSTGGRAWPACERSGGPGTFSGGYAPVNYTRRNPAPPTSSLGTGNRAVRWRVRAWPPWSC